MTATAITSPRFSALHLRPALVPGILFVLGAILFIGGGSQHPVINASLAPVGTDEFYRAFADHVRRSPHWPTYHNLILLGPVLWALAASGVAEVLPRSGAQFWAVARMAMGIGAVAWAVAFAFDGNNAPAFANAIANAGDPAAAADKLFQFAISSRTVAYLGRIGWTMFSLSFAAYGVGLFAASKASAWTRAVGAGGILLGIWTVFELARGDFTPGPFTSPYWMITALVTGIWVTAFGATIAAIRPKPVD